MKRRQFVQASGLSALAASTTASAASTRRGRKGMASLEAVTALISDWKRKDVDAVMARITDDIVWYSHVGTPAIRGKAAMRAFLTAMAAGITEIRWRIQRHAINGNQIFMEGVDDFVMNKDQRRVAIPYLGTMVFRDGLISEWRDYSSARPEETRKRFTDPRLYWAADYGIKKPFVRAVQNSGYYGTLPNGLRDIAGNVWEWTSTCTNGEREGSRCPAYFVVGEHEAEIPVFLRDVITGGCSSGTPPTNLGFRVVREIKR